MVYDTFAAAKLINSKTEVGAGGKMIENGIRLGKSWHTADMLCRTGWKSLINIFCKYAGLISHVPENLSYCNCVIAYSIAHCKGRQELKFTHQPFSFRSC